MKYRDYYATLGVEPTATADEIRKALSVLPGVQIVMAQPISDRVDEMVTGVRADIAVKIFGDDLQRHLRSNGFVSAGLTEGAFEIRDDGRPFWVVTRYAKRIGFSGEDPTGIVLVDAQTGAIEEHDIAGAPAWVDRVQPKDFVVEQLDDWGKYVRGWWNSLFSRHRTASIPDI